MKVELYEKVAGGDIYRDHIILTPSGIQPGIERDGYL